tara:strand:+ start:1392 stop:2117 length:726 start_codon:yes stop_codon:yes gene_type:complete
VKRILSILVLTLSGQLPALSEGVSMQNNPISNSSGGVNVTAVQNVPSRQFTNIYSLQQLQCQSDTFVIQPFITSNMSFQRPQRDVRLDPIYDDRDLKGLITTDENGNQIDGPDGLPDNPGLVVGYKSVELNPQDTFAVSPGISLSFNINMDRKAVRKCRQGAAKIVELLDLQVADKRLSLEVGRLSKCGELLTKGIKFKESSSFAKLCDDVEVVKFIPKNTLPDHQHSIGSISSEVTAKED